MTTSSMGQGGNHHRCNLAAVRRSDEDFHRGTRALTCIYLRYYQFVERLLYQAARE
ncbi:MAG: hypothetical protein HYV60_21390 [Planctomycetia bacterium]|nr:hypothetical protein [Planctomycetia bacterium]